MKTWALLIFATYNLQSEQQHRYIRAPVNENDAKKATIFRVKVLELVGMNR